MKRALKVFIGTVFPVLFALSLTSCRYDDALLWEAVGDLDSRVGSLEKSAAYLQVQMSSLTEIMEEVSAKNLVESVERQEDGDWTIVFSNGKTVEVVYEKIEEIAIPTMTVVEEDGKYYWGLMKGDEVSFVTDGTVKYEVDKVPAVRVDETTFEWEFSFDGGQTWVSSGAYANGEGTDTLFAGISEDEDNVHITLADGGVISLKKSKGLTFRFLTDDSYDEYGEMLYVYYGRTAIVKFSSAAVQTMTVFKPEGWTVEVKDDAFLITAPVQENAFAEKQGKVGVYVTDASGVSLSAHINVKLGVPDIKRKIRIQWTTAPDFFDELRFGSAYETGAEDLLPANTFNVKPGKLYRFRANVMGRGEAGVKALGLTGLQNTYGDFTVNGDGSIHEALVDEYEYIYFRTSTKPFKPKLNNISVVDEIVGGIGVISLSLEDEIAWTWMVCADELEHEDEVIGSGFVQQGLFLGGWGPLKFQVSVMGGVSNPKYTQHFGVFYSWGGINPQPGHTEAYRAWSTAGSMFLGAQMQEIYYFDDNGNCEQRLIRKGEPSTGLAASIKNPTVLNDLSADGEDVYADIWGGKSGEKTIFDPCPYGYKVAPMALYDNYVFGMTTSFAWRYEPNGAELHCTGMLAMGEVLAESGQRPVGVSSEDTQEKIVAPRMEGMREQYVVAGRPSEGPAGYFWTCDDATGNVSLDGAEPVRDNAHAMAFHLGSSKYRRGSMTIPRQNAAPVRCIRYDGENL